VKRPFLLAVLVLAGCSSEAAAPPVRPQVESRSASFESLPPGWHQHGEPVQRIGPCRLVANTLAASWRADRAGPFGWAADMPRDAITITVSLIGPPPPRSGRRVPYPPVARVPLELPAATESTLEGAPHVPEYRAFGRTADYLVEVRAVINNRKPRRALLREAAGVVDRLRLPDWPKRC
jgi:hypothetical protein